MTTSPTDHLVTPVAVDPVPDLAEKAIGFPQYLSPSYYLGNIAEMIFGTNPWVWVGEGWGGDWESVQRAAESLRHIADFQTDFASAISSDLATARATWHGRAAEGAQEWFSGFATSVDGQAPDLRSMAGELDEIVTGMYETANAVRGIMEQLTDVLIIAAAAATATAATGWTIIGGVASAATLALAAAKATSLWRTVLDAHTTAWNGAQAAIGLIAGYLGGLQDLELHALPGASYDHPGV